MFNALPWTHKQLRIAKIDEIIRKRKTPGFRTRKAILDSLNISVPNPNGSWSRETFEEDKRFMRDAGAPLTAKKTGVGYVYEYSDPNYKWPEVNLDLEDMHALALARAILKPYKALSAIERLSDLAKRIGEHTQSPSKANSCVPIYFSPIALQNIPPKIWEAVLEAATEKKYLCATYTGWKGQSPKELRRLAPYAVVNLEGEWYVIGTKSLQDDTIRQYKLSRFITAKVTEASFNVPTDFNIDKILGNTFGKFIGNANEMVNIRVRFDKRVAILVAGSKWHPKQKVTKCKNGDITLSFPASKAGSWPYYHVKKWILSWGVDAQVLAPKELKDLVRDEIEKMAERR